MFFSLTSITAAVVSAKVTSATAGTATEGSLRTVAIAARSTSTVATGSAVLVVSARTWAVAPGRAAPARAIIKFATSALVASVFGVTIGGRLFLRP